MDRQRWSGVAQTYRRTFARLCASTLDTVLADLGSPQARQLADVGCGAGGLSRLATERGWSVIAIDADPQMLAEARDECAGLPVRWVRAALPQLGLLAESLDVAAANFVINHVADPRAGVRELVRVVRPGGFVALTVWVSQRTTHMTLFAAALQAASAKFVPDECLPADVDFERTVDGLATLCSESGLEPVKAQEITWAWPVLWDDLWAGISGGVGALGQAYLAQDSTTRERIRQHLRQRTVDFETDGTIRLPSVAAYVLARRPDPSKSS